MPIGFIFRNMKNTTLVRLGPIKSEVWGELAHDLKFVAFAALHPELDEEELSDRFYREVTVKRFEYGEFATIEIEVDEEFNIVGGKILDPTK
jgi:hypothetical protein